MRSGVICISGDECIVVVEHFGTDAYCGWSLSRSPGQLPDRRRHIFGFQFVTILGAQPCLVAVLNRPADLLGQCAGLLHATFFWRNFAFKPAVIQSGL